MIEKTAGYLYCKELLLPIIVAENGGKRGGHLQACSSCSGGENAF